MGFLFFLYTAREAPNTGQKAQKLFLDLQTRGPKAFGILIEGLIRTGNIELGFKLDNNDTMNNWNNDKDKNDVIKQKMFHKRVIKIEDPPTMDPTVGEDVVDALSISTNIVSVPPLKKLKPNEEEAQFALILGTFLSTDNDTRQQAEENYDSIAPDKKVFLLLSILRNEGAPEEVRQLCAVLLRRLFTKHFDFVWNSLNAESQSQVKNEMMTLVGKDNENITMRKKVAEVAAELIRNLIDDDGNNVWPEFLEYLFQLANSANIVQKENALIIFALVPGIFGNQQAAYLDVIKQVLAQSFHHDQYSVRFHAAKALSAFITDDDKEESVLGHFTDLVPFYIKTMEESVRLQDDDTLLKMSIEIIGLVPKFVRPHLTTFLALCLGIAKQSQISDDWRHLALEFTVTAAETVPGAVKKAGGHFIPQYIQLLLEMMTELEDEGEYWVVSDEAVKKDSDRNPATAESSLDRFACALGGKTVLPIVAGQVQLMLSSPEWTKRYAGLMAISAVGEGCSKQMEPILTQIVDRILNFLKDPHPRVRDAACNALAQMATEEDQDDDVILSIKNGITESSENSTEPSPPQTPLESQAEILPEIELSKITVIPAKQFYAGYKDLQECYNMKSKPRGLALVVNNIEFTADPESKRTGADFDSLNLKNLFEQLGYEVILAENVTKNTLLNHKTGILSNFINKLKESEVAIDSCIISLNSHGFNRDLIRMADPPGRSDSAVDLVSDIINRFSNRNFPEFYGKPKIFLANACRGSNTNRAVRRSFEFGNRRIDGDGTNNEARILLGSEYSDIFVLRSTVPEYVSLRDLDRGTWFVECLCKAFAQYSHELHFSDLKSKVSKFMETMYDEASMQSCHYEEYGQTKRLYFNPGL